MGDPLAKIASKALIALASLCPKIGLFSVERTNACVLSIFKSMFCLRCLKMQLQSNVCCVNGNSTGKAAPSFRQKKQSNNLEGGLTSHSMAAVVQLLQFSFGASRKTSSENLQLVSRVVPPRKPPVFSFSCGGSRKTSS